MFIFRLISRLIGLAFSLVLMVLLLPLRLLRIPVAAVLLPIRIVLKLILSNVVVFVLLVLALALYFTVRNSNDTLPQLTPSPSTTNAPRTAAQPGQMLIEPVLKRENGDSAFAVDLYALMTEPERAAYSRHFYYAMTNTQSAEVYSWEFYNIRGALRPGNLFANNHGAQCRPFTEVLKVHTVEQTITGIACAQGDGGWCKLKSTATPACGLGGSGGGLLDGITSSIRNLF